MNDDELRKLIAEEIGHLGFEIAPALSILEEFGAERGRKILQQMAEDRARPTICASTGVCGVDGRKMNRTFAGRLERLEQRTPNRNSERLRIIRVIVDPDGKVIEQLEYGPDGRLGPVSDDDVA